jgi:inner membrane protein
MSQVIIDLAAKRSGMASQEPLLHPAGVRLPFDGPSDAALIIPEIRSEIRSGAYSAEVIGLLPEAVESGDRVLVIGAGLGVVSSLVARAEGVDRVIAIEANTALIPYLQRVHELNGVPEIETVNAVLAEGKKGRVPFFARRDLRTSSLLPHDRSWQQVMMVPFMDLNLILTEEQISLIICDIPVASAQILAGAELISVDRILVNCSDDPSRCWEDDGICALLVTRGYLPEPTANAVLFRRADTLHKSPCDASGGTRQMQHDAPEVDADDDLRDEDEAEFAAQDEFEQAAASEAGALDAVARSATTGRAARMDTRESAAAEPGGAPPAAGHGADAVGAAAPRRGRAQDSREPAGTRSGEGRRAGRLVGLVMLAIFLALPLILIDKIANDRAGNRIEVAQQIGATWGGAQTLTGPFLMIPVEATRATGDAPADGAVEQRLETIPVPPLVLLPETLEIDSELNTEMRRRGVFETPVYHGRHDVLLNFDTSRISGTRLDALLAEGEVVRWEQATLGLGITEPRALKGALTLNGPDGPVGFESGSGFDGLAGIHARTGDPRGNTGGWRFTLELDGSQQLLLTPAGRVTEARMHSDWAHPNFAGAFLPVVSQTGESGFVAEWSIPQLAHALPQAFRGTEPLGELESAGFGVGLLLGADLYHGTQRAAKFGFLLMVLTFGAIFLMEKSAARPPHLMQYALIGAAQSVFFALFLSLAEQIAMSEAYALAAAATIALLTSYAWLGIGLGERSLWLAAGLGLLYAVMYLVLLTAEQVLLMGAVLIFLGLAVTMWGTRNEDWGTALRGLWSRPPPEPEIEPTQS